MFASTSIDLTFSTSHHQTIISWCFMVFSLFSLFLSKPGPCLFVFPFGFTPSISPFILFPPPLLPPLFLLSTELLGHHRPKASQTARQATDAIHAVQPEGKQEGKTPIHGVCFYCLSSHPPEKLAGVWGWETAEPWRLTITSATSWRLSTLFSLTHSSLLCLSTCKIAPSPYISSYRDYLFLLLCFPLHRLISCLLFSSFRALILTLFAAQKQNVL